MNLHFEALYTEVILYFQNNIYITIALAGVLLLLLVKKTKLFFIILLIVSVNIGSFYVISQISTLGLGSEVRLVEKSRGDLTDR
jgi:uncharacterized membrane protein YeiH